MQSQALSECPSIQSRTFAEWQRNLASPTQTSRETQPSASDRHLDKFSKHDVLIIDEWLRDVPDEETIISTCGTIWQRQIPRSGAEVNIGIGAHP